MELALEVETKQLGWIKQVRCSQAIPGVGSLTALAMVAASHGDERTIPHLSY